jgi:hypothetical protein
MDVEGGRWILIRPVGSAMSVDVRDWQNRGRWLDPFVVRYDFPWFGRWYPIAQYRFVGFAFARDFMRWKDGTEWHSAWCVMAPMWFPSAICALLLGFGWRRTRVKGPGRAFPIEPAPSSDRSV